MFIMMLKKRFGQCLRPFAQRRARLERGILRALVAGEHDGLSIASELWGRRACWRVPPYALLHRLERQNYIAARWGESTPARQGLRRRYYRLTSTGMRRLKRLEADETTLG
jgi:DNA-binding PadR family transcriptional regulator